MLRDKLKSTTGVLRATAWVGVWPSPHRRITWVGGLGLREKGVVRTVSAWLASERLARASGMRAGTCLLNARACYRTTQHDNTEHKTLMFNSTVRQP